MEYIAVSIVSIVAAYWVGKKAGQAAKSLEKTRLVMIETNNLNRQVIDRLEIMTAKLRGMETK